MMILMMIMMMMMMMMNRRRRLPQQRRDLWPRDLVCIWIMKSELAVNEKRNQHRRRMQKMAKVLQRVEIEQNQTNSLPCPMVCPTRLKKSSTI